MPAFSSIDLWLQLLLGSNLCNHTSKSGAISDPANALQHKLTVTVTAVALLVCTCAGQADRGARIHTPRNKAKRDPANALQHMLTVHNSLYLLAPVQVKQIVERAYRRAKDLLETNIDVLHKVILQIILNGLT